MMNVFAIDTELQKALKMDKFSIFGGSANIGKLSKPSRYFFKAKFFEWHHTQKYPFCILQAIQGEDEEQLSLLKTDSLDAAKRAIMEDFGFISGAFESLVGKKRAHAEIDKITKSHAKNLKKWAKDKERLNLT